MSTDVPVIYGFEGGPSADGQTLVVKATGFDASVTTLLMAGTPANCAPT